MKSNIISFIFGVLIKIVDDINDYHIYKKFKAPFETILILLTIYILFLDEQLSPIASIIFFLGGIIGLLFAPHIVDAPIWMAIIVLSVLPFLYTLSRLWTVRREINIKDWKNAVLLILPLFLVSVVLSLIEDKLVPEEVSETKLVERVMQCILVSIFLFILPQVHNQYKLSVIQYQGLAIAAWGWLGYALTSVLGLCFFFQVPLIGKLGLVN